MMNSAAGNDAVFLKRIVLVTAGMVLLGTYPVMTRTTPEIAESAVAGVVLGVLHALMGYAVIRFSSGKPFTQFMQVVLAGIVVRLLMMVGLLVLSIAVFQFHAFALISSLFVIYVVLLGVEVLHIHNSFQQSSSS